MALSMVGNNLQRTFTYKKLFSFKGIKSTKCCNEATSKREINTATEIIEQNIKPKRESNHPRDSVSNAVPRRLPTTLSNMKIKRQIKT